MIYPLEVTAEEFNVIWTMLGEAPAKHSRLLMNKLQEQVEAAERKAAEPSKPAGERDAEPES